VKPRVYVAHPITSYGSEREASILAALAEMLAGAELFNPAGRCRDATSWRRSWPRLLPTLAGLVVFGDEDGSIGAGCLKELADAWRLGVPVAMFDGGRCRQLAGLRIVPDDERSGLRTAELVAGRRMSLTKLIGGSP